MIELSIKVSIETLISHLEKNKEAHIQNYEVATKIYFEDMRTSLRDMLESARNNEFRDDCFAIHLRVPVNEEAKYDKYINMLKMAEEPTITIGTDEYDRFVEDQWDWAIGARNLNNLYSSKAM